MSEVRDEFERLAREGTPRGADAVLRDARAALQGSGPRHRNRRRAPSAVIAVIALVGAIVAGGAIVALVEEEPSDDAVDVAAPGVVVGNADAVVFSASLDADLARSQIDPTVIDAVRGVDGVTSAQGALRRFVDVRATDGSVVESADEASERSSIAVQSEGATFDLVEGRLPEAGDEVAVNSVLAARFGVGVDGKVSVISGGFGPTGRVITEAGCPPDVTTVVRDEQGTVIGVQKHACALAEARIASPTGTVRRVVGVFALPGGDVDDANLLAMPTNTLQELTSGTGYDRIDIELRDGEPLEDVLDRIGAALPPGHLVVPASVLSGDQQLHSELEIQRAYHWLVSTDVEKRRLASEGRSDTQDPAQSDATYEERRSEAVEVDLRVSRVSFVDLDTAIVAYRVYYMGRPSPIATVPLTALVVRRDGRWMISSQGICQLAAYADQPCEAPVGPEDFVTAPDGWAAASTQPEAVAALRQLADPQSGVDGRIAVVEDGDALRAEIAAGVDADAGRAGRVSLNVLGARALTPDRVQLLYSLVAEGEPRLETPYPVAATFVRVDGAWRALRRYACGLAALAGTPCALPSAVTPSTTTAPPPSTTAPVTSAPASTSTTVPVTTTSPEPEPPTTTTTMP